MPEPKYSRWRLFAALAVICQVNLVAALDASVITTALPLICSDLSTSGTEAFWVGTSFLLCSTVFQPAFTSLSDLFGRKPLILIALFFFTLGCIICGWANNIAVLLAGRSIQGIGGGGIIALTGLIFIDLFPLRDRGKWAGLINLVWAVGTVAGPPIGGALAQGATWRWIFWLNLPMCGLAFPSLWWFLDLRAQSVPGTTTAKLRSFDWAGLVIFITSCTTFLLAIAWGGVQFPWSSPATLVPLILGLLGLSAFTIYALYVPGRPLVNFRMFSNRTVNATLFSELLHATVVFALFYYEPLYAQAVHTFTPAMSGVCLIPNTFAVAVGAATTGVLIAKVGHYRWSIWLGWMLTTLGSGLLLLQKESSPARLIAFLPIIVGLGMGLLFTGLFCSVQASVAPAHQVSGGAMFNLLRLFGQSLGVAVGGTIFQNEVRRRLQSSALFGSQAAELSRRVPDLVGLIQGMADGQLKSELVGAFQGAFETFSYTMCGMAAVGLLVSLTLKGYSIDRSQAEEQETMEKKGVNESIPILA